MACCCIVTCLTTMRAQQKFYNDSSVLVSLIALFCDAIIILKSLLYPCCRRENKNDLNWSVYIVHLLSYMLFYVKSGHLSSSIK